MELTPAKQSEPWFDDSNLTHFNGESIGEWTKEEEIKFNQIRRQKIKWEFYQAAFDFLNENNIKGDYHEFGCHRARTFRMAIIEARRHFMNIEFHAYDSFQGLPECLEDLRSAGVGNWKAGQLSTSEQEFIRLLSEVNLYDEKVKIHPGFYSKSLPEIKDHRKPESAGMICIDCDLYESAVDVYDFIDDIIQEGTLLYVDDYYAGYKGNPRKGVSQAQREWQSKTKWNLEAFLTLGTFGKSFICYK